MALPRRAPRPARRASHPARRRRAPRVSPHDALFKDVFSKPEHIAGILRTVLRPDLLARLALGTLVLLPSSFVDAALSARHCDLLFSVDLDGHPAFVYVLCEHQSTVDPLMALWILMYMVRIWERHVGAHPGAHRIPAILPVVVHHSAHGWTAPVAFEEILDLDPDTLAALRIYVPHFQFALDDLSRETDEAIRGRAMSGLAQLALWCLRLGRNPEKIVKGIPAWRDVVAEVRRAPNGVAALSVVWRYIVAVTGRRRPEGMLRKLLAAVDEQTQEEIVSIEEYLLEKGRKEGRREGRRRGVHEGQRRMLLALLAARFGAVPATTRARVQAATAVELDRWARRVLTASTLEQVISPSRRS